MNMLEKVNCGAHTEINNKEFSLIKLGKGLSQLNRTRLKM